MNFLDEYPRVRKIAYVAFSVLSALLLAVQAAVAALPNWTNPAWLTAILAGWPVLCTAIGFTAASNTPARIRRRVPVEDVPHEPAG